MSDVGWDLQIAPKDLVTMLLDTHGSTLTTLRLDFYHVYNLRDPEIRGSLEEGETLEDFSYVYPSLCSFEKLRELNLEFDKLVNLRDLPATLESLTLEYCCFADLDQEYLNELVQLKDKWCPVIEKVTVNGWEETNEGITKVLEHVRSMDLSVQASEDGRMLNFLGTASYLRMQSSEPLFIVEFEDEDDEEDEEDEDNEDEDEDEDADETETVEEDDMEIVQEG
jgi:hypothetical protein